MANRYKGSQHKYGVVLGGYFDSFLLILFGLIILFTKWWLAGITIILWGITVCSFTLYEHNFNKNVKYSYKLSKKDFPKLHKNLIDFQLISFFLSIALTILTIILYF